MNASPPDRFSAPEQGLGYMYQARLALLKMIQFPEPTTVYIEKDDDLEFHNEDGKRILGSLKHKAEGDTLTDLSVDFWKSVRIWLVRYVADGGRASTLQFFLFTTSTISDDSFLKSFSIDASASPSATLVELAKAALAKTSSAIIKPIAKEFEALSDDDKQNFLSRIRVIPSNARIVDIPGIIISEHLRTIRREARLPVFQRLEGWWNSVVIELLVGRRTDGITGSELSDKIAEISDEYKNDNLPIEFRGRAPDGEIDIEGDMRPFVVQLKAIAVHAKRVRSAILDYYRAFEQRSAWARHNLLVPGEIERYEDRLVEEWERFRDVVFEKLTAESAEDLLLKAGKDLYQWAEIESCNISALRIRERVTEPYVIRGGFHILANLQPLPRVHWHPRFLERLVTQAGLPT